MLPTFWWTTFDVSGMFPSNWKTTVRKVADEADFRYFPRTPVISREAVDVDHIRRGRVHADQVENGLPWLPKLYRFRSFSTGLSAWLGIVWLGPPRIIVTVWFSTSSAVRKCDSNVTSTPIH